MGCGERTRDRQSREKGFVTYPDVGALPVLFDALAEARVVRPEVLMVSRLVVFPLVCRCENCVVGE